MKFDITVKDTSASQARELMAFLNQVGDGYGTMSPAGIPAMPPNVGNGDDDDDGNTPPATIAPDATDTAGFPWDERIHAGTKAKTDTGHWRKRRGVADHIVSNVENELRSKGFGVPNAPAPGAFGNASPTPPAPTPAAAPAPGNYTPPMPPSDVPPMPGQMPTTPTPPAAPVTPTIVDFAFLMQTIQASMAANKINADFLAWLAQQIGVTAITDLANADNAPKLVTAYQLLKDQDRLA